MSVLVILRAPADPERVEQVTRENADAVEAINERARAGGCLHHRFYGGDGEVVVVDEWETPEGFQQFFSSDPDIPQLMAAAGVQGAPNVSIYRPLDIPDAF